MTCEELRPDCLLYVLGTLDGPELEELRAHLNRGCDACSAAVSDAEGVAFALATSVEGPEPPARLRKRVLAGVTGEARSRFAWLPWATAFAGIALAVAIGGGMYLASGRRIAQLEATLRRSTLQNAQLQEAVDLIQSPETIETGFGEKQPVKPRGRVFANPRGVLLIASQLPPLPTGKTYEMWIIRGGAASPAGLFTSDTSGNAVHLFRPQSAAAAKDIVAVTIENAGGVPQPTNTPILAASL
jgi:hypothetical protein